MPDIQVPGGVDDAVNELLKSLQSNIGRWVTFAITPILLPVVGAVAFWLQDKLGIDLQADPAAVTAYIATTVGGVAVVLVTWLRNRGKHEVAAAAVVAAKVAATEPPVLTR